jgi:hypothetical protein
MAHFIGNDKITFNDEQIIFIRLNCKDNEGFTYTEVFLNEGHTVRLYFIDEEDFGLINNLRNDFGYELLPRIR